MAERAAKYISGMPHFSFLPDAEIQKISQQVKFIRHKSGVQLAVQDETVIEYIYIVDKGTLGLFDLRDGELVSSGFIKRREVFGGITILMNGGGIAANGHCGGRLYRIRDAQPCFSRSLCPVSAIL